MLKKVLLGLVVIIAGIVIVAAFKSPDFRISRSATIAASQAAVFAQVNDLHKMNDWSPWLELDPTSKNSYSGAPAGVGAEFYWSGNNNVGEGRMTIVESNPNDLIRMKLEFMRPMKGVNTAEFTFVPEGKNTVVTWSMFGKSPLISRIMCLFMDMDKMVGGNFEKGLAKLKTIVENSPKSKVSPKK